MTAVGKQVALAFGDDQQVCVHLTQQVLDVSLASAGDGGLQGVPGRDAQSAGGTARRGHRHHRREDVRRQRHLGRGRARTPRCRHPLVGFRGLRCSELVTLAGSDVTLHRLDGLHIHLHNSKTDQEGRGSLRALSFTHRHTSCRPVRGCGGRRSSPSTPVAGPPPSGCDATLSRSRCTCAAACVPTRCRPHHGYG